MALIDVHLHHYPERARKDPSTWGMRRREPHWVHVVTSLAGSRPLQGWADDAQLIADMDTAGVDHGILQGWYWQRQRTCAEQNAFLAECCASSKGRLSFFASVQPATGRACFRDLEEAYQAGAIGIGEIFPAAQGFTMDDPNWRGVLDYARDRDLPVLLHVTEPVGHNYPGKLVPPLADYQRMVSLHPEVRFIFAHWGGGLPFHELNPYMRELFRNVYYDTAASPLLYRPEVWRAVCDLVDPGKVLFGSDYPLRIYPRRQEVPDFHLLLEEARGAALREEELAGILGGNACAVIPALASRIGMQNPG